MTGQLPSPPVVFGCWRSLRSCARTGPTTRRARPGKSSEEISDEGAPEKTFRGAGPGGTEGLEGPERARTIRRTAAKKRRRHTGPGGPELCDGAPWTQQPAAPADARQLVEAQRKPGRAQRACLSSSNLLDFSCAQKKKTDTLGAGLLLFLCKGIWSRSSLAASGFRSCGVPGRARCPPGRSFCRP